MSQFGNLGLAPNTTRWKEDMISTSLRGKRTVAALATAAIASLSFAFSPSASATDSLTVNFEAADSHVVLGAAAGATPGAFDGVKATSIVDGPAGGGKSILLEMNSSGAQCWAGATFYRNTDYKLISSGHLSVSVKLYEPTAGKTVKLKFENASDASVNIEADQTSVSGWNTYTFTFADPGAKVLNSAVLFPDFTCGSGSPTPSATYFLDEVTFPAVLAAPPVARTTPATLISFEASDALGAMTTVANSADHKAGYFEGAASSIVSATAGGGSGKVLKILKPADAQLWAGVGLLDWRDSTYKITSGTVPTITMDFYSSVDTDVPVMLKLETPGAELTVTAHKGWQKLTFDFTTIAAAEANAWSSSAEYGVMSIFPNMMRSGAAGQTFYVDNVAINGYTLSAPASTRAVSLSGTAKVGKTVSARAGAWTGSPVPTKSYAWYACTSKTNVAKCTVISGKTSGSLKLTAAMAGKYIRVKETGSNAGGSVARYSAAIGTVQR